MTLDIPSIQLKLDLIACYLEELKILENFTSEEIMGDIFKYRTMERLLEIIIQASLDINRNLLKETYRLEPSTNADVFLASITSGILSKNIGTKLAEAAKFRNLLAHLYDKVIPEKVYEVFCKVLTDYPEYLAEVEDYLTSLEQTNDTK